MCTRVVLGWCYSVRSASIGESDDALIAGYNPNKIPITAENDTEIMTHCVEITAGHSGHNFGDFDGKKCHPFTSEHA